MLVFSLNYKWKNETEKLISVKNIEDEIIIDCNNNIKKIYEEINELNKKSWYFNCVLLNKQTENRNIVLEENKFIDLEEMEKIEKELKITNKWKID